MEYEVEFPTPTSLRIAGFFNDNLIAVGQHEIILLLNSVYSLLCLLMSMNFVYSPQQLDVYSFGMLLLEMCTRELPGPQQKEEQIALVPDHVLRGLIRRCVQQDPEARPTMEEILNS